CSLLLQTFVKLCNKSICEISLLLIIPRSTVSGIITRWKQLGTTETQPRSGRSRKMKKSQLLKISKLCKTFKVAQQQCVESCIQVLQVQCKASDTVV
ncbi:unnamed protein product, partial [Staurois parvus]